MFVGGVLISLNSIELCGIVSPFELILCVGECRVFNGLGKPGGFPIDSLARDLQGLGGTCSSSSSW